MNNRIKKVLTRIFPWLALRYDLTLRDSHIIPRYDQKGYLFEVRKGNVKANLDGYLIAPVDMFTAKEIEDAASRYYTWSPFCDSDVTDEISYPTP